VRAISLWQPHATFVALGLKPFETRGWATAYRGPLLIHAAKRKMTAADYALAARVFGADDWWLKFRVPLGAFVCIVDLVDCMDVEDMSEADRRASNGLGDFSTGRFAWRLASVQRLVRPIPARGRQSFWRVDLALYPTQLEIVNQIIL